MAQQFSVVMGQAFRDSLPRQLEKLGGRVLEVNPDYTTVEVVVSFPGDDDWSPDLLQAELWQEWPMCSIGVGKWH